MWVIIKYDNIKKNLFKKELLKKLNEDVIFYNPKIEKIRTIKNKNCSLEINLLGDYIFCFSKNFEKKREY